MANKDLSLFKYRIQTLKLLGSRANWNQYYHLFHLETSMRSNTISLGIRKRRLTYRISRAGKHLFHWIHTIITNIRLQHFHTRTMNQENNLSIPLETDWDQNTNKRISSHMSFIEHLFSCQQDSWVSSWPSSMTWHQCLCHWDLHQRRS